MKLDQKGAIDVLLAIALIAVMAIGGFVVYRVSKSDDTRSLNIGQEVSEQDTNQLNWADAEQIGMSPPPDWLRFEFDTYTLYHPANIELEERPCEDIDSCITSVFIKGSASGNDQNFARVFDYETDLTNEHLELADNSKVLIGSLATIDINGIRGVSSAVAADWIGAEAFAYYSYTLTHGGQSIRLRVPDDSTKRNIVNTLKIVSQ